MSENPIKVEIIIPVYNRRETTLQGLRSLERIDKIGLEVNIVIVDDGSTDGTSEAIRQKFPEVEIIKGDGTLHYAAGTNQGIAAALKRNPDYIVTANDDAIFHDQFLQRMIKTAENNPRSVVGAMLLLWDEPHKVFQVGFKWKTTSGGWVQPENLSVFDFPREVFEVEGLAGNCVLLSAEAVRECGLMDAKKFPHGWGDIQYFKRLNKMGWNLLIEPKALIWCEPNTNPKPLHQLPITEIFSVLFKKRRHPLNLQRQFIARWESAPTKIQAAVAFGIYCLQFGVKALRKIPLNQP
jgi:GT2 family glycosyltransferase